MLEFARVEEVMQEVGQITISDSSIWRQVQQWGDRLARLEATNCRAEMEPDVMWQYSGPRRMGVAMDGTMIHIREEGWKELKVGCVFDIVESPSMDERTREVIELGHAVNNSYVSYLGGPHPFGERVWTESRQRGWEHASDTQVVGDGAIWIWNLAATHFYDSLQVVDWYHATEHLAQAARLRYGDGTPEAHRHFRRWETTLFQGRADQVAETLTMAAAESSTSMADLHREAGYFHHNQRRMNYLELREGGWLIGSGAVESAAKQFKARFAGPGMRWSRAGAERLLLVRSAILSSRFHSSWTTARSLPPN
jgi:hypothetical protein